MIERLTVVYDGSVGPVGVGGSGAAGFVIFKDDAELYREAVYLPPIPKMNQTVAEYTALFHALGWLSGNDKYDAHIRCLGRTLMIVNQMTGRWKAKGNYVSDHALADQMASRFSDIGFDCVTRERTSQPRQLAEDVLTQRGIPIFIPTSRAPDEVDAAKQDAI